MKHSNRCMKLIGRSEAARCLRVSRSRVLQLEKEHRLLAVRTPAGFRRFALHSVERLASELQAKRTAKSKDKQ